MHDERNEREERELYHRTKQHIDPAAPAEQRQSEVQVGKPHEIIAESEGPLYSVRDSVYEIVGDPFDRDRRKYDKVPVTLRDETGYLLSKNP